MAAYRSYFSDFGFRSQKDEGQKDEQDDSTKQYFHGVHSFDDNAADKIKKQQEGR